MFRCYSLCQTQNLEILAGGCASLYIQSCQHWFLFACGSSPLFCSRQLVYDVRLQIVFVNVQFWWQIWRQSFLFRYSIMSGMTNSFLRTSLQNFHFSQADLRPLWLSIVVVLIFFFIRERVYTLKAELYWECCCVEEFYNECWCVCWNHIIFCFSVKSCSSLRRNGLWK